MKCRESKVGGVIKSESVEPVNPLPASDPHSLKFAHHHAFIIGIDAYEKVSPLATAVNDAKKIAEVLEKKHHFQVYPPMLNANRSSIRSFLKDTMPQLVGTDDRIVFYFAGHGTAEDSDDGPAGYLVPADGDPKDRETYIPMTELQGALNSLPCRHLLLIMDCCFSGAFKWTSGTRSIGSLMPKQIYKERFDRFIHDPAWQVITSAGYDQKALDVVQGSSTGDRGIVSVETGDAHSPFALALIDALAGEADARTGIESDGLITATEVYSYVRDRVEPETIRLEEQKRQTPGFFPLRKHDKGEFIFLHPRHRLNLPPMPSRSPYKGLQSFDESDATLFYGRDDVITELKARLNSVRLLVVGGASGTGKSSVVKAGVLPWLRLSGYHILPVLRPGSHPLEALGQTMSSLDEANSKQSVLFVDQLEEVITHCSDLAEREAFMARLRQVVDDMSRIHCVIITVRSDYEPQLRYGSLGDIWQDGLYVVPPFSLEELTEVVVGPMNQEVLIFDPPELVETIIGELVQAPGALPLLSYTLDELYEAYCARGGQDRALNQSDYEKLGGVTGSLHKKADMLYQSLDPDRQATMRKIILRMVSVEGRLEMKRVQISDLDYSVEENLLVEDVIEQLVEGRLIVRDLNYLELAHDALVRNWKTLYEWIQAVGRDTLILGERLEPQANQFAMSGNVQLLWNKNPNLAKATYLLQQSQHGFNAKEERFLSKSKARNLLRKRIFGSGIAGVFLVLILLSAWALRKAAEAQTERDRALLSLFEGLSLNMNEGQLGSLCVYGICPEAPDGDGKAKWQSLGSLPELTETYDGIIESRIFVAARPFGAGHVLAYAHDGLTRDREVTFDSHNLLFAQNALAWLIPHNIKENCSGKTILVWEGTYAKLSEMKNIHGIIESRGWTIKTTSHETLENDLSCGSVLWYLSDWWPPTDFATINVPLIENFVREGGGLLMGGLGWSYAQYNDWVEYPYSADELGKPFGLKFTWDAYADGSEPIKLQPSKSQKD